MIQRFSDGHHIELEGGKTIVEFIGAISTKTDEVSMAHMLMPVGWFESPHVTMFKEIVIVIRGTLTIETSEGCESILSGEVGVVSPSEAVVFSNKGQDLCEYWAMCIPAFRGDRVRY